MEDRGIVEDYVTLQRGITYKGSLVGKPGPALLGLGSIHPGGGFRKGDYKTYGGECPQKIMLFPGDLFASLKGATKDGKMIGSVARVPESVSSGRLTQDTVKLEFKNADKETSDFLYWILRTPQYRDYCARHATGSAVVALSRDDFLNYPVPPINPTRKSIIALLEALEEKIELNRQMNETLESMAQVLFKSWFVDFDPAIDNALAAGNKIPDTLKARADTRQALGDCCKPLPETIRQQFPSSFEYNEEMGWIPEGWRVGTLGEIVIPNKGKNITKKTITFGSVPVVAGGLTPAYYHNKYNVVSPSVTISASGANAGFVNLYHEHIWASDCSYINKNHTKNIYSTYLFLKSRQYEITRMQQGAAQPHVYPKDLTRLMLANAPDVVWGNSEMTVHPYFEKTKINLRKIQTLSKLRDTLLPKLLSGEIRALDAEKLKQDVQ
jgi:type I restriction enzyme, S subunit